MARRPGRASAAPPGTILLLSSGGSRGSGVRGVGRQSYRQWGQVMVGVTGGLIALGVLVAMLAHGLPRSPLTLAWCLVGVAVSYAVFLRPCVVVDDDGVSVRNILRDVAIPWAALRGARASWSLVVDAGESSYSSWAIAGAASPGRDALKRRELLSVGGGRVAGSYAGSPAASPAGSAAPGAELAAIGSSAADIAASIGARARLVAASAGGDGDALDGGHGLDGHGLDGHGLDGRAVARRVVAWPSVLPLLASLAVLLLAGLGGGL